RPDAPWETPGARAARQRLAERRAGRALPDRDEKLVTEWNGLAIAALVEAGRVFEDDAWVAAAHRALDAVTTSNRDEVPLRSSTQGTGGPGAAGLADAAEVARAAHAVGDREAFAESLSQALGFVVFPAGGADGGTDGGGASAAATPADGGPAGASAQRDPTGASAAGSRRRPADAAGRWDGASLLDAHGDGIVPARGSDPLDNSTPSVRSALIEALRLAVGDDGAP